MKSPYSSPDEGTTQSTTGEFVDRLPRIEIDENTFLREHFAVPPLPEIAARILERTAAGDATSKEISDLLVSDAALSSTVLKLVNSAYYGLPRQITAINHAVAYLGLAEINRAVLTASVLQTLQPDDRAAYREFWRHSFYTALVAKLLARRFEPTVDPDETFAAALLHDIGRLVYMIFFPDHYRAMEAEAAERGTFLMIIEREQELPSHTRFGSLLCERWNLPAGVKRACEEHEIDTFEDLAEGSDRPIAQRMVCCANMLANLASSPLDEEIKQRIASGFERIFGCSEQEFLMLMGEVYESEQQIEGFLSQL